MRIAYDTYSPWILFLFEKVNIDEAVSVCPSPESDSSETIEAIIIKLGTVTASDTC